MKSRASFTHLAINKKLYVINNLPTIYHYVKSSLVHHSRQVRPKGSYFYYMFYITFMLYSLTKKPKICHGNGENN